MDDLQGTDGVFVVDNGTVSEEVLAKFQNLGLNPNSIADGPRFVDLESGDFRFKDDFPALRLGIVPITKYGIQEPYGLTEDFGYAGD